MARYRVDGEKVAWRIVDDEAVLIHQTSSAYFSLNPPGTYLWQLLTERAQGAGDLAGEIARRYELGDDVARSDTSAFLGKLREADLVVEGEGHDAETTADGNGTELRLGPYEPPDLVKFGDLETLILSGE